MTEPFICPTCARRSDEPCACAMRAALRSLILAEQAFGVLCDFGSVEEMVATGCDHRIRDLCWFLPRHGYWSAVVAVGIAHAEDEGNDDPCSLCDRCTSVLQVHEWHIREGLVA